ncbi:MAG TPA: prepilin-type N-terminal cleavage/methylation domain-containing protein [Candidatus Dormibacteraeota bacterium]|nr:prepilin-type N-terminal cleavage/methylation domain-containing protein [Candidatus Dormibacteraeota bacterium]
MKKLLRKQGGFTLLELLIVIVIIGILAVLIIPNLTSGPKRARDSQRKSDLRNVKTALETYYNDYSAYPSGDYNGLESKLETDYIKDLPKDPKNSGTLIYTYTPSGCTGTTCTGYELKAHFENAKDGQADANGDYTISSAN